MKMTSKAALAAALALGTVATLAAPSAFAKDDKKEQAPAAPRPSPEFAKAAGPADKAIRAKDYAGAEAAMPAAIAGAKNDYDRYIIAKWQVMIAQNKNDAAGLLAAVTALSGNPLTPAAELPVYYFNQGILLRDAKRPQEAVAALLKAQELGYVPTNAATPEDRQAVDLTIARMLIDNGDPAGGGRALVDAINRESKAGNKPPKAWYGVALSSLFKAKDFATGMDLTLAQVRDYPGPEAWHDMIAIYVNSRGSVRSAVPKQERIDLYRLQRATNSLADQNDYDDYANAAQNSGLPWEAKGVIEEGRAKGKIPAGDTTANTIYKVVTDALKTEQPLDVVEKKAVASPTGAPSAQTADAYLASGNYAKAIELYRAALTKGVPNTDEVNTRLGIALTNTGDKAAAKEAFSKVAAAPRKDIARLWLAWLDAPAQ